MFNANDYFYGMLPEDEKSRIKRLDTVCGLLTQGKKMYESCPAVNDYSAELTYGGLYDEVGRIRGFLKNTGFSKGMKAALLFRNDAMFIKLFLAVTTAGGVAIPLPAQLPREALFGSLKKFDVSYLFYADEFSAVCADAPCKAVSASDVVPAEFEPFADVAKDDDCAIFFTGGTTGRPKGALLTHGAVMAGAFNGCFIPTNVINQRYIAIIPFSHVFGMIRNLLSCLYTGSVMYTCTDMKKLFSDIAVAKPDIMVLVPALADMLLGFVFMKGIGALGGNLRTIIAGGAPVPASIIRRWHEQGVELLPGYGLTEAANLVSGNGEHLDYPDSVGFPYDRQELKTAEDGELLLKGVNMFKCYYNDPEETEAAFDADGWFKTGDLARFDEDGRLYITGRKKNIIILPNGENVSPEELELLLYRIPIIKDCLVKEYTDENGFAMIAAEIFPNAPVIAKIGIENPQKALEAEIEKVNETLPMYMRITKIIIRETDFERSAAMKIVRK